MLGNGRLAFGTILENLRKSSESGWKCSENRQKCRYFNKAVLMMVKFRLEEGSNT